MATAPLSSATPPGDSTTTTPLLASARQSATVASLSPTARTVGDEFLRAAWIFQVGCALPLILILGILALSQLFEPSYSLYDFVTYLGNTLLSSGIVFLVIVQRRISIHVLTKLCFEAAKSCLATGMWLWLFLDALLAHSGSGEYWKEYRRRRIITAAISSVLLWLLFYPPLFYTIWFWLDTRRAEAHVAGCEGQDEDEADIREDTHLLSERS